jgi:hypothetical protein
VARSGSGLRRVGGDRLVGLGLVDRVDGDAGADAHRGSIQQIYGLSTVAPSDSKHHGLDGNADA